MSKHIDRKKKIFDLFSQNLEWVKEHPEIKFDPDFSNGYICPLCFEVFYEKDLSDKLPNFLTAEDIPPKTLGGKPKALTCKICNSKSGYQLDKNVLLRLMELDFYSFLPNSEKRTTLEIDNNKITGTIKIDNKGGFNIHIDSKNSNPKQAENFISDLVPPKTIYNPFFYREKAFEPMIKSKPFSFKKDFRSDERRAEIGLLRIGYLIAFSIFGNGLLINGGLFKVREQLANPDKEILPKVFWLNYEFPDNMLGVNIITSPKELRCFLVVFNLETNSKKRQFAIALPGPSYPGIKIYENIEKSLCQGDGSEFVNIKTEHIVEDDYLRKKEYTFILNYLWQEMASG